MKKSINNYNNVGKLFLTFIPDCVLYQYLSVLTNLESVFYN